MKLDTVPFLLPRRGLNFSGLRIICFSQPGHACFPGDLSGKATVCELLQPQCHSPGRMWGLLLVTCLCCELSRAQALWSCPKHILQFYKQEWHPRNPVLGAVLYSISTGQPFNPHSVVSPPLFTRTFQFRLRFNLNISVTSLLCTCKWDNQYALSHSGVQ